MNGVAKLFASQFQLKAAGLCPLCRAQVKAEDLRDELSRKEFKISGLCQPCQDDVFGTEPDETEPTS